VSPATAGPSRLYPVVELPPARRSGRTKNAKKARSDAPGDEALVAVLRTQFDVVADAFRTLGEAMGKLRGE
jgi:hypothetical protein